MNKNIRPLKEAFVYYKQKFLMAKYGLYSKNNEKEIISVYHSKLKNSIFESQINIDKLAYNYFKTIKNLPQKEFDKLFIVKKIN